MLALIGLTAACGMGSAPPPTTTTSSDQQVLNECRGNSSGYCDALRWQIAHGSTTNGGSATQAASRNSSSAGLASSSASAESVQPQPAPGSCHAIGTGRYSRPDPNCTPGALNPAVTQATIGQTICVRGWTSTVRPPESVTEAEKQASMAAYGDGGSAISYEYDHFVPLELGGAANDPRNLWPEPGASPNPKDAVEDAVNQKVCAGQMSLAQAQQSIVADWTALTVPAPSPSPPRSTTNNAGASTPSAGGAQCSVSASYNGRYQDYDIYVHSNQPNQTVTVSDSSGGSHSWHTDGTGDADVYLRVSTNTAGQQVTARVGGASCSTALS